MGFFVGLVFWVFLIPLGIASYSKKVAYTYILYFYQSHGTATKDMAYPEEIKPHIKFNHKKYFVHIHRIALHTA